jgi:HEAT repeat protein
MADIQQLIQQLVEPATRQQGYDALVTLGAEAVDPLIVAFESTTDFGQRQITLVLVAIGDLRAVPAIIEWARTSPSRMRQSAVVALGSFGADVRVPDVLRDIARRDPEPIVRGMAVTALGKAAGQEAEKELYIEMLNDPLENIVLNAVYALPKFSTDDPTVVDLLIAALDTPSQSIVVTSMLITALSKTRDPRAFDSIAAHLKSTSPYRRATAAVALGTLGDPRALDVLAALKRDSGFAWEEDHSGPKYTVGMIAKQAITDIEKAQGVEKKPFWKFW